MDEKFKILQENFDKLKNEFDEVKPRIPNDKLAMVVFNGDLDKLLAAFIIANGAAAMDTEVVMFFTFWSIPGMRAAKKKAGKKNFMSKMFGFMLPKGPNKVKLSKMNMAGMGTKMMKGLMKKKNVKSLEELIQSAAEQGVKIYICEMTLDLMGFKVEELIDYPDIKLAGVAKFIAEAANSQINLFI